MSADPASSNGRLAAPLPTEATMPASPVVPVEPNTSAVP
jgi:hypothetical protein